jgi:hypothetical protein
LSKLARRQRVLSSSQLKYAKEVHVDSPSHPSLYHLGVLIYMFYVGSRVVDPDPDPSDPELSGIKVGSGSETRSDHFDITIRITVFFKYFYFAYDVIFISLVYLSLMVYRMSFYISLLGLDF